MNKNNFNFDKPYINDTIVNKKKQDIIEKYSELIPAIDSMDTYKLKIISLSKHIPLNLTDDNGDNLIHTVIKNKTEEKNEYHRLIVVDYLYNNQVNINIPNISDITPLHLSCQKQYLKIISYLLEKGANPNAPDSLGNTPLHYYLIGKINDKQFFAENPNPIIEKKNNGELLRETNIKNIINHLIVDNSSNLSKIYKKLDEFITGIIKKISENNIYTELKEYYDKLINFYNNINKYHKNKDYPQNKQIIDNIQDIYKTIVKHIEDYIIINIEFDEILDANDPFLRIKINNKKPYDVSGLSGVSYDVSFRKSWKKFTDEIEQLLKLDKLNINFIDELDDITKKSIYNNTIKQLLKDIIEGYKNNIIRNNLNKINLLIKNKISKKLDIYDPIKLSALNSLEYEAKLIDVDNSGNIIQIDNDIIKKIRDDIELSLAHYQISEKKIKDDIEFILYSNDYTSSSSDKIFHTLIINEESLNKLLTYNADINIMNSNGETPLQLVLQNYYYKIFNFIKNKVYLTDETYNTLQFYFNNEYKNHNRKFLTDKTNISSILEEFSRYYIDKIDLMIKADSKNRKFNYPRNHNLSFQILGYLINQYCRMDEPYTITDKHLETHVEHNIPDSDLKLFCKEINKGVLCDVSDNNYYKITSNSSQFMNYYEEHIKDSSDNLVDSSNNCYVALWRSFLDTNMDNNNDLEFVKSIREINNELENNDTDKINALINKYKKLYKKCNNKGEDYFTNPYYLDDNSILKKIYEIILFLTKIIICSDIELTIKRILVDEFKNSININEETDKIEYNTILKKLIERIEEITKQNKNNLYNNISEKLCKKITEIYKNKIEESHYENIEVSTILEEYLSTLQINNIYILLEDDKTIKHIKKNIINYFDNYITTIIYYWKLVAENYLKFMINNYRIVETHIGLKTNIIS